MTKGRVAIVVIIAIAALAAGWYAFRPRPQERGFQGYVEGYLVFMAPEEGGRIEKLAVDSGAQVKGGDLLFELESSLQIAQRNEAAAKLQQAQAQAANLRAALQRPEEIAVLRSQEERAKAQFDLSRSDLDRQRILFDRGYTAQARLDQAQSAFERDKAALEEAQKQIQAGLIAGRTSEIAAAEAQGEAAQATLNQMETRLAKRRVMASLAAQVQDVYFRTGEVVNAGQPVLALLPPENRRIRFYVPEPLLATMRLGGNVAVSCDNCPAGLLARIVFLSDQAEFTPPVIFSEQERAKLVFRVEAVPFGNGPLPIGLPVSVTAAPGS